MLGRAQGPKRAQALRKLAKKRWLGSGSGLSIWAASFRQLILMALTYRTSSSLRSNGCPPNSPCRHLTFSRPFRTISLENTISSTSACSSLSSGMMTQPQYWEILQVCWVSNFLATAIIVQYPSRNVFWVDICNHRTGRLYSMGWAQPRRHNHCSDELFAETDCHRAGTRQDATARADQVVNVVPCLTLLERLSFLHRILFVHHCFLTPGLQLGLLPPRSVPQAWSHRRLFQKLSSQPWTSVLLQPPANPGLRRGQLYGHGKWAWIRRRRVPQVDTGVFWWAQTRSNVYLQPGSRDRKEATIEGYMGH